MGFWADVKRGDKVQHSALLENNVRHMVNALNGFGSGNRHRTGSGVVRVAIWNAHTEALQAGQPVMFDAANATMCGDALPAVPCTDASKPYGVCTGYLAPKAMGDCVLAGAVPVTVTGGTGSYAIPDATGAGFVLGNTGQPVLFDNLPQGAAGDALVHLGASAPAAASHAPFRLTIGGGTAGANIITIGGGFASRNGAAVWVAAGTVSVSASGYVMLRAPFVDGEGWQNFEYAVIPIIGISVAITDADYPLGWVAVTGGTITSVESFNPPMAVFIKAGTCSDV